MPDSFKKKRNLREMLKSPNFFEKLLDYDSDNEMNRNGENQSVENENSGNNEKQFFDN